MTKCWSVAKGEILGTGDLAHGEECVTSRRDGSIQPRYKFARNEIQLALPSPLEPSMTSRTFCIPGILFLLAATVLLIITSISLPFLPDIDFVRTHVNSGNVGVANAQGNTIPSSISQLRVSGLVSDESG